MIVKCSYSLYLVGCHIGDEQVVHRVLHPFISLLGTPIVKRNDSVLELNLATVGNGAVNILFLLLPGLQAVHVREVGVEVQPVLIEAEELGELLTKPLHHRNDNR